MRSIFIGLALLWAIPSQADLLWDFKDVDHRPGTVNGAYAYVYPDSTGRKTPAHVGQVSRTVEGPGATAGQPGLRLDFVLDGSKYPSAGFGLKFPESEPLDLRNVKAFKLHLSADKSRLVRLSVASNDSEYLKASDTGVAFGCDTVVGPEGVDWVIPYERIAPPSWTQEQPPISVVEALRTAVALQINVSCQTRTGVCARDSGWVFLDSLRVQISGGGWQVPSAGGGCYGDSTEVSRFKSSSPTLSGLDGWWYAFTDANALDTSARGRSRILSARDSADALTWRPDSIANRAYMKFRLDRTSSYSGFMGLETQLGPSDADGVAVPTNIPNLTSVSFDLEFGEFPADLGGVTFHVKKAGVLYEGGLEHQIRIPYDSLPHHWCIDLKDLNQPSWSKTHQPFTPTDLLAMSWEAKLQGSKPTELGEFTVRNVRVFRNQGVGVVGNHRAGSISARRIANGVSLERSDATGSAVATLVDARGRALGRLNLAAGTAKANIATSAKGLVWLHLVDAHGARTVPVGF